MDEKYVIGVDVGTESVRGAVFNPRGEKLSMAVFPIKIFTPRDNFVEQSSDDIWQSAVKAVKQAVIECGVPKEKIAGINFDATCSLVSLDRNDEPISVSPTLNDKQNIIVWMDHRALKETEEINQTGNEVLRYVGGTISPEMEIPKLYWLKRNLNEKFNGAAKFFDLADFMVYKACGNDVRSVCTKVCKWTYLAHEKRWNHELFKTLGLEVLFDEKKIGEEIWDIGKAAGTLTSESAAELGLHTNVVVGTGIIDAHAGGIGIIGNQPETTLAIIGGTSSCHMAVSKNPLFIDGVWGPYFGAMLPGYWLNEGGQSYSGALVDHVIKDSAYNAELLKETEQTNKSQYEILNEEILKLEMENSYLTKEYHLLGYFHGNRSPRANPHLKGMISGISKNLTKAELCKKYLSAIQSVALGTRHIIESLNTGGYKIENINMCGGGTKNPIWLREHADSTGCEINLPKEQDAVLLGSAILAASAAGLFPSVKDAMKAMSVIGEKISPRNDMKSYYDKKYKVFLEMYEDQIKYKKMME